MIWNCFYEFSFKDIQWYQSIRQTSPSYTASSITRWGFFPLHSKVHRSAHQSYKTNKKNCNTCFSLTWKFFIWDTLSIAFTYQYSPASMETYLSKHIRSQWTSISIYNFIPPTQPDHYKDYSLGSWNIVGNRKNII